MTVEGEAVSNVGRAEPTYELGVVAVLQRADDEMPVWIGEADGCLVA